MSEETVLKVGNNNFLLKENNGKKYTFPPRGNLLLTDRRVIFASVKPPQDSNKRQAVSLVFGIFGDAALLANDKMKNQQRFKPQEIDEALQLSNGFAIPLSDIVNVSAQKGSALTNSKFCILYNVSGKVTSCNFYIAGGLTTSAPPNDWVEAIQHAKAT